MTNLEAFTNGCQAILFFFGWIGSLIMLTGLFGDFSSDDGMMPQDTSWFDKVPLKNKFVVVGATIWLTCAAASLCL